MPIKEENMKSLQEQLEKEYADFIVFGLDENDEFGILMNVGIVEQNSISNRDRINSMVGSIESVKYTIFSNIKSMGERYYYDNSEFLFYLKRDVKEIFFDYIIVGTDLLGKTSFIYDFEKDRMNRMVGELEEIKLRLQLGTMGLSLDIEDDESEEDNDNEQW